MPCKTFQAISTPIFCMLLTACSEWVGTSEVSIQDASVKIEEPIAQDEVKLSETKTKVEGGGFLFECTDLRRFIDDNTFTEGSSCANDKVIGASLVPYSDKVDFTKRVIDWDAVSHSYTFEPEVHEQLDGRVVEVQFQAFCLECSAKMNVLLTLNGVGNSGWREFDIGPEEEIYKFKYRFRSRSDNQRLGPGLLFAPTADWGEVYLNSIVLNPAN